MALDFLTAQKGKELVKIQIIQVLSKEHPLSLMKLHRKLGKEFKTSVSFQATRKAANLLLDAGVLSKNQSKEYEISKKWIFDSKKFFDKLSETYYSKVHSKVFNKLFKEQDYAEYKLSSLFELDNFWSDIMLQWVDNLASGEPKEVLGGLNFGWWWMINLGNETSLWEYYNKKGVKSWIVYAGKNLINEFAAKNNTFMGTKTITAKEPIFQEGIDVNVLGYNIVQVYYPKNIFNKIKELIKKYKSIDEIKSSELNKLLNTKGNIRFIYFKNPEVAKNFKEQILQNFKSRHQALKS